MRGERRGFNELYRVGVCIFCVSYRIVIVRLSFEKEIFMKVGIDKSGWYSWSDFGGWESFFLGGRGVGFWERFTFVFF